MHKTWIAGAFVACTALTAAAQAQNPNPTRVPTGAPPAPSRGGNQTVAVTGCVAPGDKTTTPAANEFVLTSARMSNDSQTGTAHPSAEDARNTAPTATGTSGSPGLRFLLSAGSTDLKPHIGHRVEVTGYLDSKGGAPQGTTGTSGNPTVSTSASSPAALERGSDPSSAIVSGALLHVESVRMIAGDCVAAK